MDKLFNAKGYSRNKLGEGVSQAGSLLKFLAGGVMYFNFVGEEGSEEF